MDQPLHSTRAVCVHDLAQARSVLRAAVLLRPLLISAPGAAVYAGCGWWRTLIEAAGPCDDLLDCADAAGYAMAALRAGQRGLVLGGATPALAAVQAAAAQCGAVLLTQRPDALDLDVRGAERRLAQWLSGG